MNECEAHEEALHCLRWKLGLKVLVGYVETQVSWSACQANE
jgi:hypothetical protein